MKRDMDLVRKILLCIETQPSGFANSACEVAGYTPEQIGYHVLIMAEAGLLRTMDDIYGPVVHLYPSRLTWQGHEFLDASRDPNRWEKAKEIIGKAGGGSIDVFKQVLAQLAATAITAWFTPKTGG